MITDYATVETLLHTGKPIIAQEYIGWCDYDLLDHVFTGRDSEGRRVWGMFIEEDEHHDHLVWCWYVRLTEEQHKNFVLGKYSLRTMLLEAKEVLIVCENFVRVPRAVYTTDLFPIDYVPDEDTFFDSLSKF